MNAASPAEGGQGSVLLAFVPISLRPFALGAREATVWTLVVAVAAVTLAVGIAGDAVPVEISSVFIPVLIVFATPFYGVVGAIGFLDPLVALVVFVAALGGPAASRPGSSRSWRGAAGRSSG